MWLFGAGLIARTQKRIKKQIGISTLFFYRKQMIESTLSRAKYSDKNREFSRLRRPSSSENISKRLCKKNVNEGDCPSADRVIRKFHTWDRRRVILIQILHPKFKTSSMNKSVGKKSDILIYIQTSSCIILVAKNILSSQAGLFPSSFLLNFL